ncbi:MAG TPA: hypothetical protein VNN07_19180 [Candidatus Tectomicrobia bacterium]|nr:hypothetical protein [Candidatus Tectomicrobia bacterium]
MPRLLFIIERNSRRFLDYVRGSLASLSGEIEVIEDRRRGGDGTPPALPQGDRRRRRTDDALQKVGWVIVRTDEGDGQRPGEASDR